VRCGALQCGAVRCSVSQCVEVRMCVAVCCGIFQYVGYGGKTVLYWGGERKEASEKERQRERVV